MRQWGVAIGVYAIEGTGILARYQTHRPVSLERVALYETLDLLTVVLHSWTKVERSRLRHGLLLLERHVERLEQNTRT